MKIQRALRKIHISKLILLISAHPHQTNITLHPSYIKGIKQKYNRIYKHFHININMRFYL